MLKLLNVCEARYNCAARSAVKIYTKKIKDLLLNVLVIVKTTDVVISRCCLTEDGTELFISAWPTCNTLIFPNSTNIESNS